MGKRSKVNHLTKDEIIKNGSIFTPPYLVESIQKMLEPYISDNSVIADFGTGYGAFIEVFNHLGKRCFATDTDEYSCSLVEQEYDNVDVYCENSLVDVSREKYGLNDTDSLVVVGNPPYNDVTSQYKKGEKGIIECDSDLLSRDMGISFLKAYAKLNADYVCVLHPLAYLIKKQNFNSLELFKDHYTLKHGLIFSSKCFESIKKANSEFPVVAALYERGTGMDYEYIRSFAFDILNSDSHFKLDAISTIDGSVKKYPRAGHHEGLQFYTLRDMNALIRNAAFVDGDIANGVEVDIDYLYQYGWLLFLKENFNPSSNRFLYGNLSPLYPKNITDEFKNACVDYAYENCPLVSKYYDKIILEKAYGKLSENTSLLNGLLDSMYL